MKIECTGQRTFAIQ